MSAPLPYDPAEELSKYYVKRHVLHCNEEELQQRIDDGLAFVRRGDRTWFTRGALDEHRRAREERRARPVATEGLVLDQDAYDRQAHLH